MTSHDWCPECGMQLSDCDFCDDCIATQATVAHTEAELAASPTSNHAAHDEGYVRP